MSGDSDKRAAIAGDLWRVKASLFGRLGPVGRALRPGFGTVMGPAYPGGSCATVGGAEACGAVGMGAL